MMAVTPFARKIRKHVRHRIRADGLVVVVQVGVEDFLRRLRNRRQARPLRRDRRGDKDAEATKHRGSLPPHPLSDNRRWALHWQPLRLRPSGRDARQPPHGDPRHPGPVPRALGEPPHPLAARVRHSRARHRGPHRVGCADARRRDDRRRRQVRPGRPRCAADRVLHHRGAFGKPAPAGHGGRDARRADVRRSGQPRCAEQRRRGAGCAAGLPAGDRTAGRLGRAVGRPRDRARLGTDPGREVRHSERAGDGRRGGDVRVDRRRACWAARSATG